MLVRGRCCCCCLVILFLVIESQRIHQETGQFAHFEWYLKCVVIIANQCDHTTISIISIVPDRIRFVLMIGMAVLIRCHGRMIHNSRIINLILAHVDRR